MENATNNYQIGDSYKQITYEYWEYLNEGGDPTKYNEKQFYDTKIAYVTEKGGLILEVEEKEVKYDEGLEFSLFKGEDINNVYSDFNGEPNQTYLVLYDEEFHN